MLVMASLLMADDLFELNQALKAAQAGRPVVASDAKLGRRLGKLAKRAEDIALDLEHP
jgi:cell division protein ZapA (FtsZ GTPase activity inhibitor)